MRDLIITALDKAMITLNNQIPSTKKDTVIIDLDENDISPVELSAYMKDNNIPDDACFITLEDDGAFGSNSTALCYDTDVPMTELDKLKFKRKRFTSIAFKFVYDVLIENGYKRVGFNTNKLRFFDNTTVYDMYLDTDFDMLENYYRLSFNIDVNIFKE